MEIEILMTCRKRGGKGWWPSRLGCGPLFHRDTTSVWPVTGCLRPLTLCRVPHLIMWFRGDGIEGRRVDDVAVVLTGILPLPGLIPVVLDGRGPSGWQNETHPKLPPTILTAKVRATMTSACKVRRSLFRMVTDCLQMGISAGRAHLHSDTIGTRQFLVSA